MTMKSSKSLPFIGRENELKRMLDLLHKRTASLIVIKGRRRIGKSRLVEEFAREYPLYQFSGIPPVDGVTAQDQRNEFALQLSIQTGIPELTVDDWSKLFVLLADKVQQSGRCVVLLDEITWMGYKDPTFLSKLKTAWDLYFKKNNQLIMVLCGSVSAWIEKNILNSTGFLGRISLDITLTELDLAQSCELLNVYGFRYSIGQKLMLLSFTGGVPWYIEQVIPIYDAPGNISRLAFDKNSPLIDEFTHIFHDLFGKKNVLYRQIAVLLSEASLSYDQISERLGYSKGSALSSYLSDLVISGYIVKCSAWSLKSGKVSRNSKYRLKDNFLRFALKYMEPVKPGIKKGNYIDVAFDHLPGWQSIMGLQFENLIMLNRDFLLQSLQVLAHTVIADGPFYQRTTSRQAGCQIDYLIQTRYRSMYVCEIKSSQKTIGIQVIKEVQEKIARMSVPRGIGVCLY